MNKIHHDKKRYIIPLFVLILILTNLGTILWISQFLITSSNVVNFSGSQRYRVGNVENFIIRLFDYDENTDVDTRETLMNNLQTSIENLEKIHFALINGNEELDIPSNPPNEVENIYYSSQFDLHGKMMSYIDNSLELHNKFEQSLDISQTSINQIIISSEELLNLLDLLTETFEEEYEREFYILISIEISLILISGFLYIYFRIQIQNTVKRSQQQSKELIEKSPFGVLYSENGKIKYANNKMASILGFDDPNDLVGNSIFNFLSDDNSKLIEERTDLRNERGISTDSFEIEVLSQNNNLIPVEITIKKANLSSNDQIESYIVFAKNLLKEKETQKNLERAREQVLNYQKMEIIGKLAGGIAHDFNNLLSLIASYSDLALQEMQDNHPITQYLLGIEKSIQNATNLTQNLLALSQKRSIDKSNVDINEEISEISTMLKTVIGQKIELKTDLTKEPCPTFIDTSLFGQIILNLAINAKEAMPNGGVLKISTEITTIPKFDNEKEEMREYIQIIVSDNGYGMSNKVLSKVFDPFYTTKENGTGLGMTMVKNLIYDMDGELSIKSEVGKGTDIIIYLPKYND